MKLRLFLFLLLGCLAAAQPLQAQRAVKDIPNVHVADAHRYVSDPDGVLSADAVSRLDTALGRIWAETTAEPAVVVVERMPDDTDIDTYATAIFDAWKIGKKDRDNGVLIVVSRDDRKAVIRTGYGAEGVLPDIICGRILRNEMFPRFKEGDYDGGIEAGVAAIGKVLTDPAYADELRSSQPNDAYHQGPDSGDLFNYYLMLAAIVAVGMTVVMVGAVVRNRRQDSVTRYGAVHRLVPVAGMLSFLTLGMAVPALLIGLMAQRGARRHRKCPNCGTSMKKIDEANDNAYLTPAQDAEEKLNSVDYDVWVCPNCRETDILPYVNRMRAFEVCDRCGARASTLVANRVVTNPTPVRSGVGEKVYHCRHCGHDQQRRYVIPKIVTPVIVGGIGGRGGGGGGFSGGSFGGGMTGGGGASGGW
ncbi:MAG: TPM domain-containing protein [Bacteroidales bacterium]|nr:TPM domain-containing protein [Bacteroidales bacterium]